MGIKEDSFYIERLKKGDAKVYRELIDRHKLLVYQIVLQIIRNKEDAEEIAQDVFLKAFNSIHTFKGNSKFSSWLYRIAYNMAISKIRTKKKNRENVVLDEIPSTFVEDIYDMEKEDRKLMLEHALLKLAPAELNIINLHYQNELSIQAISEIMGLTESNVKIKLYRARKKLFVYLYQNKYAEII